MFIFLFLIQSISSSSQLFGCKEEISNVCTCCYGRYLLTEGLCLLECPSQYNHIQNSCISIFKNLFNLDLNIFKEYTADNIETFMTPLHKRFNDNSKDGPLLTIDRGFYFEHNSKLQSMYSWRPGPIFSIGFWIKVLEEGEFLKIAPNIIILFEKDVIKAYVLYTKEDLHYQMIGDIHYELRKWSNVNLIIYQDNRNGKLKIKNYKENQFFCENCEIRYDRINYDWVIGGFKGFLFKIQSFNRHIYMYNREETIIECIEEEYWDGNACNKCRDNCDKWPWDINSDYKVTETSKETSRALASSRRLSTCNYACSILFNTNQLGGCPLCNAGCNMVNQVCIKGCPTGYGGLLCTLSNAYIFDLDLTNIISNNITDSKSSILITSGSNSSFYPNYDNNDPYATQERGYYFTGSSYMKMPNDSIIFAPNFVIYAWINPTSTSGAIFKKQDSTNNNIIFFGYSSENLIIGITTLSFSAKVNKITLSVWNFIGVIMKLQSPITYTATIYTNSNSENINTATKYWLDDSEINSILTIGSNSSLLSNAFQGFLWKMSIQNSNLPSLSSVYTGVINPPACTINQYYNGSLCLACNSACTKGCVRNDLTCNLCYNQTCETCTNFNTSCISCIANASGTPCACSLTFYWNSSTEMCSSCIKNCDSCTNSDFNTCNYCSSGYYMCQSVCVSSCPNGYIANTLNRTCTLSYSLVFLIQLNAIQDIVYDSVSSLPITTGSNTSFYPTYTIGDPIAAKDRGYYFTGTSYMQAPPNSVSSSNLILSPQFTISMWINPTTNFGCILTKQLSTDTIAVSICLVSGNVIYTILIDSIYSLISTPLALSAWNYVQAEGFISSSSFYQLSLYINNTLFNSSSLVMNWFSDTVTNLTFGASISNNSFTNYYIGFLYEISIYNDLILPTTIISSACVGCSYCPISSSCIPNCPISYYWNGTQCVLCASSCALIGCVRYDTSCNHCIDLLCRICSNYTSICATCKTGAILSSNICACQNGLIFNNITEECEKCINGCSSCTAISPIDCSACSAGFYLINNACLSFCPTGYIISGNSCILDSSGGFIFSLLLTSIQDVVVDSQKKFQVTTGVDSSFYPNYTNTDPMASPRGYYFSGNSYMNLSPNYANSSNSIIFSSVFTISAWIRYTVSGTILNKQINSSPYNSSLQLKLIGSNLAISLIIDNLNITSTSEFICNSNISSITWHQIAIAITLNSGTYITFIMDGVNINTLLVGHYLLIDYTSNFIITIGADYGATFSSYYTGYLYSLKIWNINVNPIVTDTGTCIGCLVCPYGGCIPNCSINQYWDGTVCQSCNANCANKGCIRNDINCNLCASQLCYLCNDFSSCETTQNACIPNASPSPCACNNGLQFDGVYEICTNCSIFLPSGECQCGLNTYSDPITQSCLPCFSYCSECTSGINGNCTSCANLSYMNPEFGLCLDSCPEGYIINGSACAAITPNSLVVWFEFTQLTNNVQDSISGHWAFMGSTSNYLGNFDPNDPFPCYHRGLYFSSSQYVLLPPNLKDNSSIILGNTHTIRIWARLQSQISDQYIMSKEDGLYLRATIYINSTSMLSYAVYRVFSDINNTGIAFTVAGPGIIAWDNWFEISVILSWSSSNTEIVLFINGNSGSKSSFPDAFFQDIPSNTYTLGYSKVINSYIKGFIYEIRIYNYQLTISSPSTSCGCEGCTIDNNCLDSCKYLEYFNGTCQSCNTNCLWGCVSEKSCNLNEDYLCLIAKNFSSIACTKCVPLAIGAGNGCNCVNNSEYNSTLDACVCVSGYYVFENNCIPCYYPLQHTDLQGYFSEDYLSLIFNSSKAVKNIISSNCSDLFNSSSYSMFGINASCSWSSNRMILTVTLGINATVTNESITFQSSTMFTDLHICDVPANPIIINIGYLYPKPNIIPIPLLSVPFEIFLQCDDLLLDASQSLNGYNRPLSYKWVFISSPHINVLSGFEDFNQNNSQLFFPRANLSTAVVSLTLTISNWLGFSALISKNFQIIAGEGLQVIIDDSQIIMSMKEYKSIGLNATSPCSNTSKFEFSWTIIHASGIYAMVDFISLWQAQVSPSIISITPYLLQPGLYTFQVNATDTENNLFGTTEFALTIAYQDLIAKLPADYLTVYVNSVVTIKGKAIDPDSLPGNLNCSWSCNMQYQDCTNLIVDPSASILTINTGLKAENYYNLTFIVSKDTRSTSSLIILYVVSFEAPTVEFSLKNPYVNPQLPLIITATISKAENYSYLWTLESGDVYQLMSTLQTTQIAFEANSLTQGFTYVWQFEVISGLNITLYKISFTVIQQPVGGSFSVYPNNGIEASTIFLLQALNWIDPTNPDTGILTYQFGCYLNDEEIILNIHNQSSVYYTQLPYATGQLIVWLKVINSYGSYSLHTFTVEIQENNSDKGSIALSSIEASLANAVTILNELPSHISMTALYYLKNSSISEENKSLAFASILSAIDKIIQIPTLFQNQDIENILSVILVVVNSYKPSNMSDIISRLYTILSIECSSGIAINLNQISLYAKILEKASGFNNTLISSNPAIVSSLNNHLKNILIAAGTNMGYGQTISYQSKSIQLSSTYYQANNFTGYSSPKIPGYLSSVSCLNVFISNNPLLAISIIYDDNGASFQNDSLSTSIDFSLVEITSSGNITLSTNLSSPLILNLPIYNYSSGIIECVYMVNAWNSYGCSVHSFINGIVTCSCNHTSLFSAGINLVPSIKENKTYRTVWAWYYIFTILGFWTSTTIVLLLIDRKELIKRSRVEQFEAEHNDKLHGMTNVEDKSNIEKKSIEIKSFDIQTKSSKIHSPKHLHGYKGRRNIRNIKTEKKSNSPKTCGLQRFSEYDEGNKRVETLYSDRQSESPKSCGIQESYDYDQKKKRFETSPDKKPKFPTIVLTKPLNVYTKKRKNIKTMKINRQSKSPKLTRVMRLQDYNNDSNMIFRKSVETNNSTSNLQQEIQMAKEIPDSLESNSKTMNFNITKIKQNLDQYYSKYLYPSRNLLSQNYFISFLFFYEPYYYRFVRCLVLFTSLCIQACLIGLELYFIPELLSIPDTEDNDDGYDYITIINVIICLIIAIIGNIITGLLKIFMENLVLANDINQTIKNRKTSIKMCAIFISLVLILGCSYIVYFLSYLANTLQNIIWLYLILIGILCDILIVQSIKILIKWLDNSKEMKYVIVSDEK